MELVDYKDGSITFFDGKPDDDGSDDGMGECKGVRYRISTKPDDSIRMKQLCNTVKFNMKFISN